MTIQWAGYFRRSYSGAGNTVYIVGQQSNMVLYSPDNAWLFQSNQFTNSINTFQVNPDGSLVNVGKFGASTQVHTPAGMATDATGTFLYVADDAFGVAVFRIGNGGVLAALSDLAINRPGEIQDLVAYPARSCTTADLTLTMAAVPATAPAGAPIQYQLSIKNNSNITVSSAVVADTFPPTLSAGKVAHRESGGQHAEQRCQRHQHRNRHNHRSAPVAARSNGHHQLSARANHAEPNPVRLFPV